MANVMCDELLKTCRRCGKRFPSGWEGEECDECGESRKCGNMAVVGYTKCTAHGGPVPSRNFYGVGAGPSTGARSKFPITRLASKYMEVQNEGRLLSNRHSIEILRERIRQLAERIDTNEAPERLERLAYLWKRYNEAVQAGSESDAHIRRNDLDAEFTSAYHDYAAWKQMFEALELDSKLVQGEVKILKDIRAIITAEDAYELTAKLLAAVMRVINDDPKKMKQVQYEFARIIGDVSDDVAQKLAQDDGRGDRETIFP